MNIQSDLLVRWLAATGRGQTVPGDSQLEIPPALLPVLSVVGPMNRFGGFSNTLLQRESWAASQILTQGASAAAQDTRIGTFGRGIWDVSVWATYVASYNQVFTASPEGVVILRDPGGSNVQLLAFYAVLNVPQFLNGRFQLLIVDDDWFLTATLAATGVGETQSLTAAVIANRLQ